jgi:hypothetical protein
LHIWVDDLHMEDGYPVVMRAYGPQHIASTVSVMAGIRANAGERRICGSHEAFDLILLIDVRFREGM